MTESSFHSPLTISPPRGPVPPLSSMLAQATPFILTIWLDGWAWRLNLNLWLRWVKAGDIRGILPLKLPRFSPPLDPPRSYCIYIYNKRGFRRRANRVKKKKRERDGQPNSLGIRPNFMLGDTKRIGLPFFSFVFGCGWVNPGVMECTLPRWRFIYVYMIKWGKRIIKQSKLRFLNKLKYDRL